MEGRPASAGMADDSRGERFRRIGDVRPMSLPRQSPHARQSLTPRGADTEKPLSVADGDFPT